jgi:nucleotide-binding universal stress UspA family protein
MQIRKIIVGTDLTDGAKAALEAGLDLARHVGAEVVLVHATMVPDYETPFRNPPSEWTRALESMVDEKREALGELRERYDGRGTKISHVVVDSVPSKGVAQVAEETDADLVVVGTHGRKGLRRLLLGSVAKRTVRHCKRSVLVARPKRGREHHQRVLVPTDFSPASEVALEMALTLVADRGTIELLHCWQMPSEGSGGWALAKRMPGKPARSLQKAFADAARERGAQLLERYPSDRAEARFSYIQANPKDGILRKLDEEEFDMVVMGNRGHRGLTRWLLGSVAESVVRHAPCSVLVARGQDEDQAEDQAEDQDEDQDQAEDQESRS